MYSQSNTGREAKVLLLYKVHPVWYKQNNSKNHKVSVNYLVFMRQAHTECNIKIRSHLDGVRQVLLQTKDSLN
jgi:hypothetical protein